MSAHYQDAMITIERKEWHNSPMGVANQNTLGCGHNVRDNIDQISETD